MTELALVRAGPDATAARRISILAAIPKDVLVAGLGFLAAVLLQGGRLPDLSSGAYWDSWSDQSKYLTSARAFTEGDLDPARHWYPLLYPLAIAAFWRLPVLLAATIVNAICYGATYFAFRRVAARFDISSSWALLLFIATTLIGDKLAMQWIVPWTTTLSAALIWLLIARASRASDAAEAAPRWAEYFSTGLLLGLIPLCRPADAVISAILGAFVLYRVLGSPRRIASVAALTGGASVVVAAYGALHLAIYGPRASDYMNMSAAYGVDLKHLGWKAQTLLVYSGPFFPFGISLVERFPWLQLGAAGLLVSVIRPERRRLALLVGLPMLAYAALMLAYADLTASSLWTLRLVHYFKWLMPGMGLFAYDFVRSFLRRKTISLAALGAVVAAGCVQYKAVAAGPDEPAKLLLFSAPDPDFDKVYHARSIIADGEGRLRNRLDYHQTPDRRGLVYVQASRRDFAGREIWRDTSADVNWPVMQPTPLEEPVMLGDAGEPPLARYRAELALGVPCWISRQACDRPLP